MADFNCAEALPICAANLTVCGDALSIYAANLTVCARALATALVPRVRGPHDGDDEDCEAAEPEAFGVPLHIGGIFIILAVSFIGTLLPLLGKYIPRLALPRFAIALGKAMGTGIIISCALIHMLLPANDALTNACLSASFTEDYVAYGYLFCLIGALIMHNVELVIGIVLGAGPADAKSVTGDAVEPPGVVATPVPAAAIADCEANNAAAASAAPPPPAADMAATSQPLVNHSHSHGAATAVNSVLDAAMLEVALNVHSVIIGLAVGLAPDDTFVPLLVALVFHQFFEGIALGARLFETDFSGLFSAFLSLLFALSAPVGMAIGTGLVGSGGIATNSVAFLVTTGVLDGLCAGILLYIGFSLLFSDFSADVKKFGGNSGLNQAALIFALWVGAAAMAIIGRWL
jgi:zinc transporter 1/2/3